MAKTIIINGNTYSNVPFTSSPLSSGQGDATFWETSDATAAQAEILNTKTAYINGGKTTGSMPNNGSTSGTISTKDGTVNIPQGYTSGGTVGLDSTFKNALVSGNIKSGATIGGVPGSSMVVDTTISSGAATKGAIISGYKAYVNGALVEGNAAMPTITQDSTTHGLTIR